MDTPLPNNFKSLWKKVEKFEKDHLPASALGVVNEIYIKAQREKRDDQLIKAVLYKAKLFRQVEDIDQAETIHRLRSELLQINSREATAIYHSLLGELLHQYGARNAYRLENRTGNSNDDNEDIANWSLRKIQERSIHHFDLSIRNLNGDAKLEAYEDVLLDIGDREWPFIQCQSIQEFLLMRALFHFMNDRTFIALPVKAYKLNDPDLFAPKEKFADLPLETVDTMNFQYKVLRIIQSVLKQGLASSPLVNLKRYDYLKAHSTLSDKDSRYEAALLRLAGDSGEASILAQLKLARLYMDKGQLYRNAFEEKYSQYHQKADSLILALDKAGVDKRFDGKIRAFRAQLAQKELSITLEEVVPSWQPFPAYIKYRNTSRIHFRLYKLDGPMLEEYRNLRRGEDRINFMLGLEKRKEWSVSMPVYKDLNHHATEIPIDPLEKGIYVLLTSNNENFVYDEQNMLHLNLINVSDLTYVVDGMSQYGHVLNRKNGQPVHGAKVSFYKYDYDYTTRANKQILIRERYTDEAGAFAIKGLSDNYYLVIEYNDDILDLRQNHYAGRYSVPQNRCEILIFTDRAIYRPGQTVHFKGMALDRDGKSIPGLKEGTSVDIVFRDVNHQIIEERSYTTTEYGTFSGMVMVPMSGLTGQMRLEARCSNGGGSQTFSVEEYKRPKIFAKIDQFKDPYVLGDTIVVRGTAESYSGSKVAQATVDYTIEKQPVWRYGNWRFPPVATTSEIIGYGQTDTNENGDFSFSFLTEAGERQTMGFVYVVKADITDITGETTMARKTFTLSDTPVFIDFDLPSELLIEDSRSIAIRLKNIENEEVPGNASVRITELITPVLPYNEKYWGVSDVFVLDEGRYRQLFPNYAYKDESDPRNWKAAKDERIELFPKLEDATLVLNELDPGAYRMTINASDEKGNKANMEKYILIGSQARNQFPPTKPLWLSGAVDSAIPGDSLVLNTFTPYKDAHIIVRITHNRDERLYTRITPGDTAIIYPIREEDRGGLGIEIRCVYNNRFHTVRKRVEVPWTHKTLAYELKTFRSKIYPGSKEEWTLVFKDDQGMPVSGELLASMYDMSLDQFVHHNWQRDLYPVFQAISFWQGAGFGTGQQQLFRRYPRIQTNLDIHGFSPTVNWHGFYLTRYEAVHISEAPMIMKRGEQNVLRNRMVENDAADEMPASAESAGEEPTEESDPAAFPIRKNLNETVFFYPDIHIDETGSATVSFTMNEALTKWKFQFMAHTRDLAYVFGSAEVETSKELMVIPNLPRFLRQGDTITLNAKVSNLTDTSIECVHDLEILDAITGMDMTQNFLDSQRRLDDVINGGGNSLAEWTVVIPHDHLNPVIVRMKTTGHGFSDGEENIIPILSNRILVHESMPFFIKGKTLSTFTFSAMNKMHLSPSLVNESFTLESTDHPAWLAVKSIPYLLDYPLDCTEQIFNKIYATLLADDLMEKYPRMKDVIRLWQYDEESKKSPLEKNPELKNVLLNESPWVRSALSESANMQSLVRLTDPNVVIGELQALSRQVKDRQTANGGFVWFPGGRDNWYMTQYLLENIGYMKNMGIEYGRWLPVDMISRAVHYIDTRMKELYADIKDKPNYAPNPFVIHYLYTRGMFRDIPLDKKGQEALEYFKDKVYKKWGDQNTYLQALVAMASISWSDDDIARSIFKSLDQRMIRDENVGYYWNDMAGYYWYNPDIEKQAALIALYETMDADRESIDGLKLWLLRHKQVNQWKSTKATASAIHALLINSASMLHSAQPLNIDFPESPALTKTVAAEAGTGYRKLSWKSSEVSIRQSVVKVRNPNENPAWGALHWQYFEDMDKVKSFKDTPLQVQRMLYREVMTDKGRKLEKFENGTLLKPGQRLIVRIELDVDRPMEFIHMQDSRGAGLEPENVLSQYKWQGGLGYYESTKDLGTHFFIDYLPKGHFVFEYPLRVVHQGNYSHGLATIQSMYAPEFSAHSEGIRIVTGIE